MNDMRLLNRLFDQPAFFDSAFRNAVASPRDAFEALLSAESDGMVAANSKAWAAFERDEPDKAEALIDELAADEMAQAPTEDETRLVARFVLATFWASSPVAERNVIHHLPTHRCKHGGSDATPGVGGTTTDRADDRGGDDGW